ncbi:MAG: ribose-5-phosphate isomerase [Bacteroidetes bacterium]|nr:MAG: ribose-5-phosphate isomerase [Bacteroidota bacterium]
MNISIGNDHAGTNYKFAIIKHLKTKGITVKNYGTDTNDSVDYPDFIHPVAKDVETKNSDFGIIICGSGNGSNMTANKHLGVRSALCWTKEITALARQHNNANILSIPARFITLPQTIEIVDTFLNTAFEEGRHERRVEKIDTSN